MKMGAVAAQFAYISREGELNIKTGEGDRVTDPELQKALLKTGASN
jgi:hypothetical protein